MTDTKSRPRTAWSPDAIAALRRMVHREFDDEEIARALNRSVRSIAIKRARLGLTVRTLGRASSVESLSTHTLLRELRRRGFKIGSDKIVRGVVQPRKLKAS